MLRATRSRWLLTTVILADLLLLPGIACPPERAGAPQPAPRLMVHEVVPRSDGRQAAWIELYNPATAAAALAGARLVSGPSSGLGSVLPSNTPEVPARGFAVIALDQGSVPLAPPTVPAGAVLVHAPADLASPWTPSSGELSLYLSKTSASGTGILADDLAWGRPRTTVDRDRRTRWPEPWFVPLADTFGDYEPTTEIAPLAAIGRLPGTRRSSPATWARYDPDEVTPGAVNAWPRPRLFTPASGATVAGAVLEVAWAGAAGPSHNQRWRVELEVASGIPVAGVVVSEPRFVAPEPLRAGTYRLRVRHAAVARASTDGVVVVVPHGAGKPSTVDTPLPAGEGAWSASQTLGTTGQWWDPTAAHYLGPPTAAGSIGTVEHLQQHKDTRLLCLDGCDDGLWDRPWPAGASNEHGANYCVEASVAMMASAYLTNTHLSQDRIAHWLSTELLPGPAATGGFGLEADQQLRHNLSLYGYQASNGGTHTAVLEWALGAAAGAAGNGLVYSQTMPPFLTVKKAVDSGRPLMIRHPGHVRVIAGYAELPVAGGATEQEWLMVLDPALQAALGRPYAELASGSANIGEKVAGAWIGPTPAAASVQHDEPGVADDADGDGLRDFDETRLGTDAAAADSDQDGVPDKADVTSYVHDAAGTCVAGTTAVSDGILFFYTPDGDGDGLRKEMDADNDSDGCADGVEDTDRDGLHDQGERCCFVADCTSDDTDGGGCP